MYVLPFLNICCYNEINLYISFSIVAGTDFQDQTIPVHIPAGQTSVLVDIPIINDNETEQLTESFSVTLELDEDSGLTIAGDGSATVTVTDDDSE